MPMILISRQSDRRHAVDDNLINWRPTILPVFGICWQVKLIDNYNRYIQCNADTLILNAPHAARYSEDLISNLMQPLRPCHSHARNVARPARHTREGCYWTFSIGFEKRRNRVPLLGLNNDSKTETYMETETFYREYCGHRFSNVRLLTSGSCPRHPDGSNKGRHKLYQGGEKTRYTCKYCGRQFPSILVMVGGTCPGVVTAANCCREPGSRHPPSTREGRLLVAQPAGSRGCL